MNISIAIPAYECHGLGWLYVNELLLSISKQNHANIQVVLADQSTDDHIFEITNFFKRKIEIKYLSSKHIKRSNSANANYAIQNCDGDLIKIMFMDDFFTDSTAISEIAKSMALKNSLWCINGSLHCKNIHFLDKPMIPKYHEDIHLGENTISSPSVLTLRNKEYFDENLIMLMDCDMYKKLYIKYGAPLVIETPFTCNRSHKHQLQHSVHGLLQKEIDYCREKYN